MFRSTKKHDGEYDYCIRQNGDLVAEVFGRSSETATHNAHDLARDLTHRYNTQPDLVKAIRKLLDVFQMSAKSGTPEYEAQLAARREAQAAAKESKS